METRSYSDSPWTNIAIIGSAQHGKSTLAGFLLYALGEVDRRVMNEAEKAALARGDLSRKFAFLLDRKPDERTIHTEKGRGQTRETSWWGFEKGRRRYLLMDSPGQYTRVSHVIGALSEADAAVLVVDTHDYLEALEQPKVWRDEHGRVIPGTVAQVHAYLSVARFYGVKRLVVALHKMDRLNFSERGYQEVKTHLELALKDQGWDMSQVYFIPTAVRAEEEKGYNVVRSIPPLSEWYQGPTFVEALERLYPRPMPIDSSFRMQVNYVYQGGRAGIPGYELVITGKILSGFVQLRDELLIQPSGVRCRVRSIRSIDQSRSVNRADRWGEQSRAVAGELVGLGCRVTSYDQQLAVRRGEIAGPAHSPSRVSDRLKAEIVVLHVPSLSSILSGLSGGTFGLGYFRTGFHVADFSLDGRTTWKLTDGRAKEGKKESLKVEDLNEGNTISVELTLARQAPLDCYIEGTNLGRFVLLDQNLFLLCGGHIKEVL